MLYITSRTYLFYNWKFVTFGSQLILFVFFHISECCLVLLLFNYSILEIIYLLFCLLNHQLPSVVKSLYLIKSINYVNVAYLKAKQFILWQLFHLSRVSNFLFCPLCLFMQTLYLNCLAYQTFYRVFVLLTFPWDTLSLTCHLDKSLFRIVLRWSSWDFILGRSFLELIFAFLELLICLARAKSVWEVIFLKTCV